MSQPESFADRMARKSDDAFEAKYGVRPNETTYVGPPAEDFVWVDIDEITALPGPGFHHVNLYRDYWWVVNDKRQVAFFQKKWRSPQCNHHKSLVERAVKNIPGAQNVVCLPVAYLKPSS